jgi:methylated-DNA-[protein]-cysteine S-methyltransferase
MDMQHYHAFYASPVGRLTLVAQNDALVALLWEHQAAKLAEYTNSIGQPQHLALAKAAAQLAEYFAGNRQHFHVPLSPKGTAFQQAAWRELTRIPYGQTRSYAEQATAMQNPKAVRAVGAANGRNPLSIFIPCHRVIGANGALTGYGGGVVTKKFLLELERNRVSLGVSPVA